MRDTRMVERKKTGKAKARKKVSLISLAVLHVLTLSVRLGQEIMAFQLCISVISQYASQALFCLVGNNSVAIQSLSVLSPG